MGAGGINDTHPGRGKARVTIPLKVLVSQPKTILAVYKRITRHYHVALALAGPPGARRIEPHILVDRAGLLGEEGTAVVSGPKALAPHEGLAEAARKALRGARAVLHLRPWGIPVILVVDARPPDPEEKAALDEVGHKLLARAAGELARHILVEEA